MEGLFGGDSGAAAAAASDAARASLVIVLCVGCGWLWQRDSLLQELKKNDAGAEQRLFWKIWPLYVKWLCPVIIGVILAQSVL